MATVTAYRYLLNNHGAVGWRRPLDGSKSSAEAEPGAASVIHNIWHQCLLAPGSTITHVGPKKIDKPVNWSTGRVVESRYGRIKKRMDPMNTPLCRGVKSRRVVFCFILFVTS